VAALPPGHPERAEDHCNGNNRNAEIDIGFEKSHAWKVTQANRFMTFLSGSPQSTPLLVFHAIQPCPSLTDRYDGGAKDGVSEPEI
jgi:hypothetical protein